MMDARGECGGDRHEHGLCSAAMMGSPLGFEFRTEAHGPNTVQLERRVEQYKCTRRGRAKIIHVSFPRICLYKAIQSGVLSEHRYLSQQSHHCQSFSTNSFFVVQLTFQTLLSKAKIEGASVTYLVQTSIPTIVDQLPS